MINIKYVEQWKADPKCGPELSRSGDILLTSADKNPICAGGWHIVHDGIREGSAYDIVVRVRIKYVGRPRDALQCTGSWFALGSSESPHSSKRPYFFLIPRKISETEIEFRRVMTAPPGAKELTIRYAFKWTLEGCAEWSLPSVRETSAPVPRKVRAAVVTGSMRKIKETKFNSISDHVKFYGSICEDACRSAKPDLIVLPELSLQWRLSKHGVFEHSVAIPGFETDIFAKIAAANNAHIVVATLEQAGSGRCHNAAAVIGPKGVVGIYRKVHLAPGESESGITPGESFPVFQTPIGRLACNICMDSSSLESSRLAALVGAEILALPIMGDFRADRHTPGEPVFDEIRWKAIMMTRAMDNSMHFVIARNDSIGSCIVDPLGSIIAWNDGTHDFINAEMELDKESRMWNGCLCRDALWVTRRPHLYGIFTDAGNNAQLKL